MGVNVLMALTLQISYTPADALHIISKIYEKTVSINQHISIAF
jgi:hypothetical protein